MRILVTSGLAAGLLLLVGCSTADPVEKLEPDKSYEDPSAACRYIFDDDSIRAVNDAQGLSDAEPSGGWMPLGVGDEVIGSAMSCGYGVFTLDVMDFDNSEDMVDTSNDNDLTDLGGVSGSLSFTAGNEPGSSDTAYALGTPESLSFSGTYDYRRYSLRVEAAAPGGDVLDRKATEDAMGSAIERAQRVATPDDVQVATPGS